MEKGKEEVDLGHGLKIVSVAITDIREQDKNARLMKADMFKQLVANIKKRGTLESLPLVAKMGDRLEIVSGHHRIRAAKEAGLKEISVLVDDSGMNRSQLAAKQLAHNSISGFDDQDTLRQIARMITDVDDMLESFVGKDILEEPMAEIDKLLSPKVEFDWKTISFLFLPHQLDDLQRLLEVCAGNQELVGLAERESFSQFAQAVKQLSRFNDVKAIGTVVDMMTKITLEHLGEAGYDDAKEWDTIASIFGGGCIPKEASSVIKEALKMMIENEEVGQKNRWQALEMWAADYLAGQ